MIGLQILLLPLKAAASLWQVAAGWWIGRRRGWRPDTRDYGAASGYEIQHGPHQCWWDGRTRTPINTSWGRAGQPRLPRSPH